MSVTMIGRGHQIGDGANSLLLRDQQPITDRCPRCCENNSFRRRPAFFLRRRCRGTVMCGSALRDQMVPDFSVDGLNLVSV